MDYLNALNTSAVTFILDLASWGWAEFPGPGWEVISPYGEIRAFRDEAAARAWRASEVSMFVATF